MNERVVKFRVWNGLEMDYNHPISLISSASINDFFEGYAEIMQFTGLIDNNGKEIWEGDLVGCGMRYDDGDFKYGITEVKWEGYGFNMPGYAHDFYLLGNIYEQETFKKATFDQRV